MEVFHSDPSVSTPPPEKGEGGRYVEFTHTKQIKENKLKLMHNENIKNFLTIMFIVDVIK